MKTMKEKLTQAIQMVCHKGTRVNLALIYGRGGTGKTTAVFQAIQSISPKLDFTSFSGRLTQIGFYNFIEANKNRDVIVLDDVANLLQNETILNFAKALTGTRADGSPVEVSYGDQQGMRSFVCRASLVIITNNLNPDHPDFGPVKDRAVFLEYSPNRDELWTLMRSIVDKEYGTLTKEDRLDVLRMLHLHGATCPELSLRHLMKALDAKVSLPASEVEDFIKDMFTTPSDQMLDVVAELIKMPMPTNDQIQLFHQRTCKSRRLFFLLKAKLKKRPNPHLNS